MLAQGGELGRERYEAATATLRQRAPAYNAYDDARTALTEKKPEEAERLAQQAVRLLPGGSAVPQLARRYRFEPEAL